jgi:hypothetical protein
VTARDWLIVSSAVKLFAMLSVFPLFATAFGLWVMRRRGDESFPAWRPIVAWLLVGAACGLDYLGLLRQIALWLRPEVSGFPENWGGYLAVSVTPTICLILLGRAQREYNSWRGHAGRGFEVLPAEP